jgi:hypothetical protein
MKQANGSPWRVVLLLQMLRRVDQVNASLRPTDQSCNSKEESFYQYANRLHRISSLIAA